MNISVQKKKTFRHPYRVIKLVVAGNVLVKSAQHYHCDHARQEEYDNERIQNAEPLDFTVRHRVQDVVPTRGPFDVILALKKIHNFGLIFNTEARTYVGKCELLSKISNCNA